ncbi:protein of unknown function [Cupriavidus taiwanensis]|uniref:Uncharacterized protein n=1 Tax=Cupriavidus taiwanensis TaxID=164546 RepID=A0A375IBU7_9BURK|nr:protein of unknown function [Cupriavidus taiwanensis]
MQQQRGHAQPLQIVREVDFGELANAGVLGQDATRHALRPECIDQALGRHRLQPVETVERNRKLPEELRSVSGQCVADAVEDLQRNAIRVRLSPGHQWNRRGDQNRLRDARAAMPADVAHNLAAADGVSYQGRVLQIKRADQRGQIIGVRVDVIPAGRLIRTPVPAAIVRNDAEPALHEQEHLCIPSVSVSGPAVRENDRAASAPVLVEKPGTVRDSDVGHVLVCVWKVRRADTWKRSDDKGAAPLGGLQQTGVRKACDSRWRQAVEALLAAVAAVAAVTAVTAGISFVVERYPLETVAVTPQMAEAGEGDMGRRNHRAGPHDIVEHLLARVPGRTPFCLTT